MQSSSLEQSSSAPTYNFGPDTIGAKLLINPDPKTLKLPEVCAFDYETDGSAKQHFVGVGIAVSVNEVWYFTEMTDFVKQILSTSKLIAHNVKADLHFAKSASLDIPFENILGDTQLMSYCIDSSRMKHGLKALAVEMLGLKWPSYDEMTESNRISLAVQPVEKVARYCGMDALATLRLFYHLFGKMTTAQKRLHWSLELPEAIILYQREQKGILFDVEAAKKLRDVYQSEMEHLEAHLVNVGKDIGFKHSLKPDKKGRPNTVTFFNPNAPAQGVTFFNLLGIEVEDVAAETMEAHYGNPVVDIFAEYKHLAKVKGTYLDGMLELPTLPNVHTDFTQTVTITGRLSSRDPNLQNIPSKGRYGDDIRNLFIARPGHTFLDADFSNMELRVAAHFSQEPVWLEAFNADKDVHQAAANKIGKTRQIGKLFNLSVVYGVGARKLAKSLGCSVKQAERELDNYWKGLPKLYKWIEATKAQARKTGCVRTLLGRVIPYPAIRSDNKWVRLEAERQCVNAIIQGSSAEITKLADIALYKRGLLALLPIHDELLFEVADVPSAIEALRVQVTDCMEGVVKLSCPMKADLGVGKTWLIAKCSHCECCAKVCCKCKVLKGGS